MVFAPSLCRRRSVPGGVSAPSVSAVRSLARSFPGFGVCLVRASGRSFSGFVAVCSFGSRSAAVGFSSAASRLLGAGCFCLVRPVGSRFRVAVPVAPSRPLRLARSVGLFLSPSPVVLLRFRSRSVVVPLGGSSAVAVAVSSASCVGFSGSRSPSPASLSALASAAASVPASASVLVGCASGVDLAARSLFPSAVVLAVASGAFGVGRSAFARRSVACVGRVVAAGAGGLWVSFPAGACPPGLVPSSSSSRCFSGSGSGSWASLAFAAGSGVPCLVFLPAGVGAPSWLVPLGGGWFSFSPPVQLSLF